MQYKLLLSLRRSLPGCLLLLVTFSLLEGRPLVIQSPDTIIERGDYQLVVKMGKEQTDLKLIDYNERHEVRKVETTAFEVDRSIKQVLAGIWSTAGVLDANSRRCGTVRLLPKIHFGTTMMLGDAFAHAKTPCFNHYLIAPIGYRYYIGNRSFVGLDIAFEGRDYSLRDGYFFSINKEHNELTQDRYGNNVGLRRSELVTRYISLPITLGMLPLAGSRMRVGIEVIPQFKYKEYVMHEQYANRHKERTTTQATPPLSMSYGAFVDFRPFGLYIHYTPQSLLLIQNSKSGYSNRGLLTAGISITL